MTGHRDSRSGITPIAAFSDNYLWWIRNGGFAAVVDPGDAAPVLKQMAADAVSLRAIVLTHHHGDHVGGVAELVAATGATVYGPANEAIAGIDHRLREGDRVEIRDLDLALEVIEVPGHTAGHIAYFGRAGGVEPVVFCGDTLFACGCGRLFEGTPAQMNASLGKLARLPEATRVYCAHEYTLANVRFARVVEPDNAALRDWEVEAQALRAQGRPTLPTTIGHERAVNPFLRVDAPAVRASVARHAGGTPSVDPVETFALLREWKNGFR